jgi:tetratricopeptide (TPR) repeat protein
VLALPDVTLCCVDTANHALALRALARSRVGVHFGRALFLTDALPSGMPVSSGIEVVPIAPIASRESYSDFVLKSLLPHIETSHVLLVQWDGYVINPAAWDVEFLTVDYVGAKWFWYDDGMRVGNGGFSLRSRRLLEALQDARITRVDAEDTTIGRTFRPLLEREHRIRFATEALADRFSFEAAYPIGKPFGFHGLYNFCRTVPPDEIAALCADFSDAIARSLQFLQLLRNCSALGQWNAAVAIGRRIVAAAPDHVEARGLLQAAERRAAAAPTAGRNEPCPCGSGRKFKQCHGSLSASSTLTPVAPDPEAQVRAALATHMKGDIDDAERAYRAVLAAAPENPLATHYLGVALYQRNRIDEAIPLLARSVIARPQEPEFHNNLGLALAAADRHEEAIAAYRRTLAANPAHAIAWNNLGLALHAALRLPAAIAAFREAIAHKPDFAQAHWNLSLALLAHGDFRAGWREYAWRESIPDLAGRERAEVGPRWDGIVQAGVTLLVTAEQGLGDMLQFIRLAQPIARKGMQVLVSAPKPLVRLLATAPGVAHVFAPDDARPRFDAHAPILALANALEIDAATIPATVPYITADKERCAQVAVLLAPYAGRRKVGLAWQGSRHNPDDRHRSIDPRVLSPLLAIPGIAWFSLQRGEEDAEAATIPGWDALVRLPARNDFDGTAAIVAALDLVISVDTSLAHLSGALAKPTWIMLPFAPDWRWQTGRTDSPWYPTARLFRQPKPGAWEEVIRNVAAMLAGET